MSFSFCSCSWGRLRAGHFGASVSRLEFIPPLFHHGLHLVSVSFFNHPFSLANPLILNMAFMQKHLFSACIKEDGWEEIKKAYVTHHRNLQLSPASSRDSWPSETLILMDISRAGCAGGLLPRPSPTAPVLSHLNHPFAIQTEPRSPKAI